MRSSISTVLVYKQEYYNSSEKSHRETERAQKETDRQTGVKKENKIKKDRESIKTERERESKRQTGARKDRESGKRDRESGKREREEVRDRQKDRCMVKEAKMSYNFLQRPILLCLAQPFSTHFEVNCPPHPEKSRHPDPPVRVCSKH